MTRTGWSALLLAGVLTTASCGQPATEPSSAPSAHATSSFPDCDDSHSGTSDAPSLKALMATPEGWTVARSNQSLGDPSFVDFLAAETGRWVEDGCFSAWSHDDVHGALIIHVFRFDTAEHATEVWQRLRDVDGWDERYEIEGLPSIHVAVGETPGGARLHEAHRHVGRHLVTFALTGGSVSERPDPALEQILRHHVQQFPS